MTTLLPPSATAGERAVEDGMARGMEGVDVDAPAALWDASRCPPALLDQLAWALDLPGRWPTDDEGRRRAVRGAIAVHRVRGTRAALDWTLRDAGIVAQVVERPAGAAYVVRIDVLNSAALAPDLRVGTTIVALAEATGQASVEYQVSMAAGVNARVGLTAVAIGAWTAHVEAAA